MEKKYKLTEETTGIYGRILHRIEALKDFGNVKKGDKGGFVENEENLSQYRNCWIYGNAKVCENALVRDDAEVYDNAEVCGNVLISDNAHGNCRDQKQLLMRPDDRPLYSKGAIFIGENVWIGEKAAILSGVHVGDGAVIGANSVVTHDVPAFSIVAGCPAKIK